MRDQQEILHDAEILYNYHSETDETPITADIILVAGSHDLRVPEYAARLYHEGVSTLIVCTGGLGKITDGLWSIPEGDVFARRCIDCGVPEKCIVVERDAKNTGDNFKFSKAKLDKMGVFPKTGVIVSKPYMAKRAWATGSKQWPEVEWQSRVPQIQFRDYWDSEEGMKQEINLMVGDLQRLRVYADNGFQVPVEIPEAVWNAYERLVSDGFDRFVIKP